MRFAWTLFILALVNSPSIASEAVCLATWLPITPASMSIGMQKAEMHSMI